MAGILRSAASFSRGGDLAGISMELMLSTDASFSDASFCMELMMSTLSSLVFSVRA